MAQLDLPLPEITVSDFERSWTRLKLVASTKEWGEAKKKVILPMQPREKLVDVYVALNEETRASLPNTKKALIKSAGIRCDPMTAGQAFMSCHQLPGETVRDYAMNLRKLFTESYPDEEQTSAILLQRFLTGLSPSIFRQLLLKGKPSSLTNAIADATNVEYALNFESTHDDQHEINVVHHKQEVSRNEEPQKLQLAIDQMTKKLEALKTKLEATTKSQRYYAPQPTRRRPPPNSYAKTCWLCGEL